MTNIILVVEKPGADTLQNEQIWKGCTNNLSALASKYKDIQSLGVNVLLISLDKSLDGLSKVIPEILGLGYKYLILNEDTKWIEVSKKV